MVKRIKIKKGDQVRVIAGEDKGKEGRVLEVYRDKNRILIEGINMITKHVKPNAVNPQGGIEKKEASINASNALLIDAQGNATRVGRRRDDNGNLVRFSKKSGEDIK